MTRVPTPVAAKHLNIGQLAQPRPKLDGAFLSASRSRETQKAERPAEQLFVSAAGCREDQCKNVSTSQLQSRSACKDSRG